MRGGGLISAILVVWVVIGAVAAFQRGYLKNSDQNCASLGTIAVTVPSTPAINDPFAPASAQDAWPVGSCLDNTDSSGAAYSSPGPGPRR